MSPQPDPKPVPKPKPGPEPDPDPKQRVDDALGTTPAIKELEHAPL